MIILNLQAENIKRLIAIDITPDKKVVKITGKNKQGKTTILDCIWWVLGGAKNIQSSPIRTGESEGYITIKLSDGITATRKFKYDNKGEITTSLKLEGRAGSPQAVLDKIVGDLSFDPNAFNRMDKKKQFDILKKFVPAVNFDKIDTDNKVDFDERTILNRQYKDKKAACNQSKYDEELADNDMIDEDALTKEIEKASKRNSEAEKHNHEIKTINDRLVALRLEARDLKEKLEKLGNPCALQDISELSAKITSAREINRHIILKEAKQAMQKSADDLKKKADKLTKNIEKRNGDKQKAITEAKIPVDNISFGDGEILLDGKPYDQGSDAEQLQASISIAMALNPELRVIRVRDGSLLDDDSMKTLEELAEKHDFQVWIEIVDGSGKVGFVIEEGQVKNAEINEPPTCPICDQAYFSGICDVCGFDEKEKQVKNNEVKQDELEEF